MLGNTVYGVVITLILTTFREQINEFQLLHLHYKNLKRKNSNSNFS